MKVRSFIPSDNSYIELTIRISRRQVWKTDINILLSYISKAIRRFIISAMRGGLL